MSSSRQSLLKKKSRTYDHWWPTSVQRLWLASDDSLGVVNGAEVYRKKIVKRKNRIGGAYTGHYHDFGESPWSHSFESVFNDVDREGIRSLRRLQQAFSSNWNTLICLAKALFVRSFRTDRESRAVGFKISERDFDHLVRLAVSLAIRAPASKYAFSSPHPTFDTPRDARLGNANCAIFWERFQDAWSHPLNGACVHVLHSVRREFIFGDGCFEAFTSSLITLVPDKDFYRYMLEGDMLIALTPHIAMHISFGIYQKNSCFYLPVSDPNAEEVNEVTRLCSREVLFFRNERPTTFPFPPPLSPQSVNAETSKLITSLRRMSRLSAK